MKKLILISLLIAFTASARIGETRRECIKRYGIPIRGVKNGNDLVFTKGRFNIRTIFINGICEFIHYDLMIRDNKGDYELFTDLQKTDIISINFKQKCNSYYGDKYSWISADKSIFAGISRISIPRSTKKVNRLSIATLKYRRQLTKGL